MSDFSNIKDILSFCDAYIANKAPEEPEPIKPTETSEKVLNAVKHLTAEFGLKKVRIEAITKILNAAELAALNETAKKKKVLKPAKITTEQSLRLQVFLLKNKVSKTSYLDDENLLVDVSLLKKDVLRIQNSMRTDIMKAGVKELTATNQTVDADALFLIASTKDESILLEDCSKYLTKSATAKKNNPRVKS